MSKPPGAKEAADRAKKAASKACEFLTTYQQEADEASKEFEALRDAAKEAKILAGNLDRAVSRDLQPSASAVREAVKQLREATNPRSAKVAAKKVAKELQSVADAVKRADEVLQSIPGHFAEKLADSKSNMSQARRKKVEVHAAEVVKAVEAVSAAAQAAQASVLKAIAQLRAIESLEAAADSALVADRTADTLQAVAAVVRNAADSIEASPEVRWPTTGIWVRASRRIAELAKVARENVDLAKNVRGKDDEEWLELANQASDCARHCEKQAREKHDSAIAVEVLLNVVGFFDDHKPQIFDRLEECDNIANQAISNSDMLFIAESLPIINGIIHVGSARKQLKLATNWVQKNWGGGEAHPRIVLSALLFKYVTDEGGRAFINKNPPHPKEAVWKRIQERVEKLL